MQIYFAASIRGGRALQARYQAIVAHLQQAGHTVLSEGVAFATLQDAGLDDRAIYVQDVAWLDASDLVVAEVSIPSLGVGYEIGYALHRRQIPVICLCEEGAPLSAMIHGNPDPALRLIWYRDLGGALAGLDAQIAALTHPD